MWNPDESELIESWLSFRELHERGLVRLNPWKQSYKALSVYDGGSYKQVMQKKTVWRECA